MSLFGKLFGSSKKEDNSSDIQIQYVEPNDNPWGIRVLDLRPFTTGFFASNDPQEAVNSVSYGVEDGSSFWGVEPENQETLTCNISVDIDKSLQPGVLFVPETMDQKWAIFYDGQNLIFVRSWLRKVFVIAKTSQSNNKLIIENIKGKFTEEEKYRLPKENSELTKAILQYLLNSHSNREIVPAPLPKELETYHKKAIDWVLYAFGNVAQFGVFDNFVPVCQKPLRSNSLLHIAIARADITEINRQVSNGADINSLAGDGWATLHWAFANDDITIMKKLLNMGADPNVKSTEGVTPIMTAVEENKIDYLNLLLKAGAMVNLTDNRGFTALHRAADLELEEIVKILLDNGADKSIIAQNHSALTFAQLKGNQTIINYLK